MFSLLFSFTEIHTENNQERKKRESNHQQESDIHLLEHCNHVDFRQITDNPAHHVLLIRSEIDFILTDYTSLHFTSLHFTSLHFTSHRSISLKTTYHVETDRRIEF